MCIESDHMENGQTNQYIHRDASIIDAHIMDIYGYYCVCVYLAKSLPNQCVVDIKLPNTHASSWKLTYDIRLRYYG